MKEIGEETKRMEKESSSMQMEMCMKETGKTIKLMAKANTLMPMEQFMMEIGWTTSSMDLELKVGLMAPDTKANMLMVKKKVKERFILLTDLSSMETLEVMRSMDLALMNGQTAKSMKANG
jgi:hypothetical protein